MKLKQLFYVILFYSSLISYKNQPQNLSTASSCSFLLATTSNDKPAGSEVGRARKALVGVRNINFSLWLSRRSQKTNICKFYSRTCLSLLDYKGKGKTENTMHNLCSTRGRRNIFHYSLVLFLVSCIDKKTILWSRKQKKEEVLADH